MSGWLGNIGRLRQAAAGPLGLIEVLADPVLIADRDGAVLAANRAFRQVLDSEPPATCCEAICSATATGECLTRATLSDGASRLTTMRQGEDTVTVRSAGLQVADGPDVAALRLELAATAERPPASSRLRMYTLGTMRVEAEDGPSLGEEWLMRRSGQLLGLLVVTRGRLVPNDEIAEALWPSLGTAGAGTVRHAVHVLRSKLEPERAPGDSSRYIVVRRGCYLLNLATVWIDADAFETGVRNALDAYLSGDPAAAERGMHGSLRLYRGDFLADRPYAEWAIEERERLRDLALLALRVLTEIAMARDDLPAAADHLEQLTRMEPLDVELHRLCTKVLVMLGRHSRALRHHDAFVTRMRRVLGDEPPFTVADIAREAGSRGL